MISSLLIPHYSLTTCVLLVFDAEKGRSFICHYKVSLIFKLYTTPIWAKEAHVQSILTQLVDF